MPNLDLVLTAWTARTGFSREAAQECSPRRQPWVGVQEPTSPKGRQKQILAKPRLDELNPLRAELAQEHIRAIHS